MNRENLVLIGFLRVRGSRLQASKGSRGVSARFHGVPPFVLLGGRGFQELVLRQAGVCSGPSAEALGVLIRVLLKALRFSKVFC